jgi:hypothetical protein
MTADVEYFVALSGRTSPQNVAELGTPKPHPVVVVSRQLDHPPGASVPVPGAVHFFRSASDES